MMRASEVASDQRERATRFRCLHANGPLLLPNAWDAASALVIERMGAPAIATTSAGISWSHGRGDGQNLDRETMMRVIRSIVQVVRVPVTADVEAGYGAGLPRDVADTVRGVIAAGAVGINLEDSPGPGGKQLLAPEVHAERLHAAREVATAGGADLFINARIDVYLFQVGEPEWRFDESVRRAGIYLAAGADCVFVPGVMDAKTIGALVRAIDGPVNVTGRPGAPGIPELRRLGVARVSLGSAIALAALTTARDVARELLEKGTYRRLEGTISYAELDGFFSPT